MPRNASGVYSAPNNTTAVPGETIKSSQFNNVIGDLVQDANSPRPISAGGTGATTAAAARVALGIGTLVGQDQDSVQITGGEISGVTIRAPAASSAEAPGFAFENYPGSGMYVTGAGALGWSIVGTPKATLGQDFSLLSGAFRASVNDTPGSPAYSWTGASDYGLFLKSTNDGIGVSIGGTERLVIDRNVTVKGGSFLAPTSDTPGAPAYGWDGVAGAGIFLKSTNDAVGISIDSSEVVSLGENLIVNVGSCRVPAGGATSEVNYAFRDKINTGMHCFVGSNTLALVRDGTARLSLAPEYIAFSVNGEAEVARITEQALCIGVSAPVDPSTPGGFGCSFSAIGAAKISRDNAVPLEVRRGSTGGVMLNWWRGTTNVAAISEDGSGSITYGTFCGAHWSQGPELLPGTIVETVDALAEWEDDEYPMLPKYQVASAGSRGVYGVWSHADDDGDPIIAGLGAYKIRIAPGETVQLHDLIVCGGDGLGVPQADDILRSSTVAKVTSTTVLETYPDGSFLVPAVLYCG